MRSQEMPTDGMISNTRTRQAGLTLIELIIAIMVTGLAFTGLFAAMQTGVNMQVYVREMSDAERIGPAVLSQISEDLRNVYYYNVEENAFFEGRGGEVGGGRIDQMHFLTARSSLVADPAIDGEETRAPVTEVGWLCKPAEEEGFLELHRREDPFSGEGDLTSGGYYRLVSDRVLLFKVQYTGWDFGTEDESNSTNDSNTGTGNEAANANAGQDGEGDNSAAAALIGEDDEDAALVWEDDWSSMAKMSGPVAVKIELVVAPDVDPEVYKRLVAQGREDEIEKSYVHVVTMPQFREEDFLVNETSNWDGTVRESAFQQAGGIGNRGANGQNGQGGGNNRDRNGGGNNNRDRNGGGGNNRGGNNDRNAGGNPFSGASTGNNPFLNATQGGNR